MTIKEGLKYVLFPITLLIGIITFLLGKNKKLKSEIGDKDFELQIKDVKYEQEKIDSATTYSIADYHRIRASYERSKLRGDIAGSGHSDTEPDEAS